MGLKQLFSGPELHFAILWIEPLWDWNHAGHTTFISIKYLWIEPLWDWNVNPLSHLILTLDFESNHCGIETISQRRLVPGWSRFESNHCGIETRIPGPKRNCLKAFESNHCGIETWRGFYTILPALTLNRTIVGLKPSCLNSLYTIAMLWIEPLWDWNLQFLLVLQSVISLWIEPLWDWNINGWLADK